MLTTRSGTRQPSALLNQAAQEAAGCGWGGPLQSRRQRQRLKATPTPPQPRLPGEPLVLLLHAGPAAAEGIWCTGSAGLAIGTTPAAHCRLRAGSGSDGPSLQVPSRHLRCPTVTSGARPSLEVAQGHLTPTHNAGRPLHRLPGMCAHQAALHQRALDTGAHHRELRGATAALPALAARQNRHSALSMLTTSSRMLGSQQQRACTTQAHQRRPWAPRQLLTASAQLAPQATGAHHS